METQVRVKFSNYNNGIKNVKVIWLLSHINVRSMYSIHISTESIFRNKLSTSSKCSSEYSLSELVSYEMRFFGANLVQCSAADRMLRTWTWGL